MVSQSALNEGEFLHFCTNNKKVQWIVMRLVLFFIVVEHWAKLWSFPCIMSLLRAIPTKEEACTVKLGLMSAQRALTTFHRGHYFLCGPFHTIIYPIPHDQLSFPPFLLLYIPLLSPVPCTSPHTTQTRQSIGCPFVPPWCNSEASLCLCVVPPVAYTLRALGAGVLLPSFFRLTLTGVQISATLFLEYKSKCDVLSVFVSAFG